LVIFFVSINHNAGLSIKSKKARKMVLPPLLIAAHAAVAWHGGSATLPDYQPAGPGGCIPGLTAGIICNDYEKSCRIDKIVTTEKSNPPAFQQEATHGPSRNL
jgi:hypothetical protein